MSSKFRRYEPRFLGMFLVLLSIFVMVMTFPTLVLTTTTQSLISIAFLFISIFMAWKTFSRSFVLNPPRRAAAGQYKPPTSPAADCRVTNRIKLGDIIDPPTGNPLFASDAELNRHMVIVGQSGSGKTVCIENILWQQVRRGGGAIFIDGKLDDDTYMRMKKMMQAAGRMDSFLVLNPDNTEISHTYNPMMAGDTEAKVSRVMSTYGETSGGASEHFAAMNATGLTVVINALHRLDMGFNFKDLSVIMSSPQAFMELFKLLPEHCQEKVDLATYMEQLTIKTMTGQKEIDLKKFKENLGGVAARMSTLAQGAVGEIFNAYAPEIDIFDCITQQKVLYVMLPSMEKSQTTAKYIAQFVISDIQSAIAKVQKLKKHEKPRVPFLLLFDEFGAYATTASAVIWEQARSAGICACAAFQTFSSLQNLGRDFMNKIMGNSMVKIFYALRDADSPEMASNIMGYQDVVESSSSHETIEKETAETKSQKAINVSRRQGSFQKVGANMFKELALGQCIVSIVNDVYKVQGPLVGGYQNVPDKQVAELTYVRKTPPKTPLRFDIIWERYLRGEHDFAARPDAPETVDE